MSLYYREWDVTQPYPTYNLDDSSLYDDNGDGEFGSIAAFPRGAFDKRGAAYSQWRKNGKRAQVCTLSMVYVRQAIRDNIQILGYLKASVSL